MRDRPAIQPRAPILSASELAEPGFPSDASFFIDVLRQSLYGRHMIKSWANSATRRLAEEGKCKFSGLDEEAAMDLLASLEAATSLDDLSPLKSVGLHKLSGDGRGQWAMRINGPWRVCFRFDGGDAWDVEIVDYH